MAEQKINTKDILTIVLGVAALALAVLLLYNQWGSLQAARESVKEERMAVARIQDYIQEMEQAKDNIQELEDRYALVELMMPTNPDEDVLITSLRSYADATGTSFLKVNFKQRASKEGYSEMPVDLVFEGSYPELLQLLEHLQAGQRAMRVESLKVSKARMDAPVIKADINASAFYAPR